MIKRLLIENYVLIERLDIEFEAGLNIVTGETGAGKSILLGALSLLLGARLESSAMKDEQRNCIIEGTFQVAGYGLQPLFEQADLEYDNECVIRRIIAPSGKSRAYVNDLPVALATLKQLGGRLIDIHSQHQTLLIGDTDFQMSILDSVSNLTDEAVAYHALYSALKEQQQQLKKVEERARQSKADEDYIRFQFEQLWEAKLKNGEQEELEIQQKSLAHATEIKEGFFLTSELLSEGDEAVTVRLKTALVTLQRLTEVYPAAHEISQRIDSVLIEVKDIQQESANISEEINIEPEKLAEIEQRLDFIYSLQQKHQATSVEELIALMEDYDRRLGEISNFEDQIAALKSELEILTEKALKTAEKVTEKRKKGALFVEKQVKETLKGLGMTDANLKIEITPAVALNAKGLDDVKYLFSANKGGNLQPIEKVASGGEMSRLMLALKSLIAEHSQLPTIIFDEIDTGVSGAVADKMGEIIAQLSSKLQIINITHLPQVASKGDHHFFVYKDNKGNVTNTHIRKLSQNERVAEIAKMISGTNVTTAAVEQAKMLLSKQE